MLRLGFEPGAAGWWSHMDPKSYGSYDTFCCPLQKEDLDTILQEMNVKNYASRYCPLPGFERTTSNDLPRAPA